MHVYSIGFQYLLLESIILPHTYIRFILIMFDGGNQKQKFVKMLVNNVGYFNGPMTINQINQFLHANESFNPRQTIRRTNDDNFYSFVELGGFVQIGKSLCEMYIGVPRNYPQSPPVFLININRSVHNIYNEQQLLKDQTIMIEKNQFGDQFIRLRLPLLEKQWGKGDQTLLSVFNQTITIINNPPILSQSKVSKPLQQTFHQPIKRKLSLDSEQVKKLNEDIQMNGEEMLSAKSSLLDMDLQLDYVVCRQQFLKNHLPSLRQNMSTKTAQISKESEKLQEHLGDMELDQNCDGMLDLTVEDAQKLQIISEQQALKEGQAKLRAKIEEDESAKFGEYKKVMKILFDRMFDNQTKLLRTMS